jgi:DNA-binding SARP family transcriptional activator/Tfp pilus assembly protein PilF
MHPMAVSIEFGLLGPLVVRRDGQVILVPGGKPRAVLAALLLNPGQLVAAGQLAEVLWGADPPPSARASLQNHVKRLRQALGQDGRARIVTRPGGYAIRVASDELDVARFQAALTSARAAARDRSWEKASAQASAALLLWRGEPLADVGSDLLAQRVLPHLTEICLQAWETRLEAEIELGRHAETIVELRRLVAEHPLREHFHALLMLALRQCGQRADALTAYQAARRILIAEVGVEPGPELRREHEQILASDRDAVTAPDCAMPDSGVRHTVAPRQLPAPVREFVGRDAELAALNDLADRAATSIRATLVMSAIGGMAGIGKTTLALYWSHQVADQFPDGQLYVNLRGYDVDQPMLATDALAGFLNALGMPSQEIPAEVDDRAAAYRSLLAGRRVLIVLDNAREADQIRPLLPGSSSCVVVVTSRDTLAGLVARDGAARLELDLLPLEEAVALLRELVGERVDSDPDAAARMATCCGRLPLALRVAAELAVVRTGVPLSAFVSELAGLQQRLDLLDAGGDSRTDVRSVFSWSYQHLDTGTARSFRLLSLHPGPDLEVYAAAALICGTAEQAGQLLDRLARAHLIRPAGPGRYGMHDLLRTYARELADSQDGEQDKHQALTRLFDYYLHTAAVAMDVLFPVDTGRRPLIPVPASPVPPVGGAAAARSWLDTEQANLVAVAAHTADHGWPGHTTRLSAIVFRYLDVAGRYAEAITIHRHARRAASKTGDMDAETDALNALGAVDLRQGRYQQAAGHYQQAITLCRTAGDRTGEARTLGNLGIVDLVQGRYPRATGHFRQTLALCREIGDRPGEARTLHGLGFIDLRQGRYQQAARRYQQGLALCRALGDTTGEARMLNDLGEAELRQGLYQQASDQFRQALTLCRETGSRTTEVYVLVNLGLVDLRQGHCQQAAVQLHQALSLAREFGDRAGEAEALNGIGEVSHATGCFQDARAQHAAALAVATQIGEKYEQARAHDGLGRACQAAGHQVQAHQHGQEALALYTELGTPQAQADPRSAGSGQPRKP